MKRQFCLNNNLKITAIVSLVIIGIHFSGLGGVIYWFGGLIVLPGILLWVQLKRLTGRLLIKVPLALTPWLVFLATGLYVSSQIEHEGQRSMSMSYFEMVFFSIIFYLTLYLLWEALIAYRQRKRHD